MTVRNVAAGADCSTTGVYTHFGGKQGLADAIFVEGFESFETALASAGPTFYDVGLAYRTWALERPTHYQVMFGSAIPGFVPSDEAMGTAGVSFDHLAAEMGDPTDPEARQRAFHVWATVHGYVMLEILGMNPPGVGTPEELYKAGLNQLGPFS